MKEGKSVSLREFNVKRVILEVELVEIREYTVPQFGLSIGLIKH